MTDVTPADLDRIANWSLTLPIHYTQLMTFVRGLWSGTGRWDRSEGVYEIDATEDDEDLLDSLRDNAVFWGACWQSSNRHGRHVFHTPHHENLSNKQ